MAVYAYAWPVTTIPAAVVRRASAELVGSALLSAMVVGSGIAAAALSRDVGIQLLINSVATAFGLFVLISVFGPISGAHFNPVVSLADYVFGLRGPRDVAPYIAAQIVGCIAGSMLANVMFDLPPVTWSTTQRISPGHLVGEVVATAGLILVIFTLSRTGRSHLAAAAVAAYIGSAYFFTSSTSFANPAITIGRMFSDTFAGIAPGSAPLFIGAQLIGALAGIAAVRLLTDRPHLEPATANAPPKSRTAPLA